MRGKKIVKAGLIVPMIIALSGSVAGCGASLSDVQSTEETIVEPEKKEVVGNSSFEIPVQIPGIYVDQEGYETEAEKRIIFCGKDLPESYDIIDLETGQVVYSGEVLKPVYDEKSGNYSGFGQFNDFKNPGKYYVKADVLGESYAFSIKEDIYEELFDEACKKFYINRCGIAISGDFAGDNGHSACHTVDAKLQESPDTQIDVVGGWHMDEQADRDSLIGCKIVENLLLGYEMNPKAFTDESGILESGNEIPDILDEVKYEVDWLLKMQDERSGGIYGAALTTGSGNGDNFAAPVVVTPVSLEATINFAAAMGSFSYLYQEIDEEYATRALRAADRAWTFFVSNQSVADNTAAFKAAAKLYRATGEVKYEEVLKSYFSKNDFADSFNKDENIFLGAVTYLSTNQQVDKDQCEKLIKLLMKRSEQIAAQASESRFFVSEASTDEDFAGLLDDMRCLAVTNHIIYNYEYKMIIENHLHFVRGMNPSAMNYVSVSTERTFADDVEKSGIMNDPQKDALFIFMISAVR